MCMIREREKKREKYIDVWRDPYNIYFKSNILLTRTQTSEGKKQSGGKMIVAREAMKGEREAEGSERGDTTKNGGDKRWRGRERAFRKRKKKSRVI